MKKIALLIAITVPALALGQSIDQNYIRNKTYKEPTGSSIPDPSQEEAVQSITYYDGLGRPIQQIAHKQSGTGNDLVTHIQYDAYGRPVREYLPIVNGQTLNYHGIDESTVTSYYGTPAFPGMEITSYPFSEKLFEASPFNRVLKQASPGDDWKMNGGHEIGFEYLDNDDNEVRLFEADADGFTDSNTYYSRNTLYKTITKNENWTSGNDNTTEEFKDKEGHVVLKRAYNNGSPYDTYYVYDDYGNLAYVIPPIVNLNETVTSSILDNLGYQYKYDNRNRLIRKKLPGKQWEYIAYNSQNLPVAMGPVQSPWGANEWGWMITKYDIFGRVVYTGWYSKDVNEEQRANFETGLTTGWAEGFKHDAVTIDGVAVNYTNNTSPTNIKLLTINYYDTYDFVGAPSLPGNVEGESVLANVRSLATGNWVRILDNPTSTKANVSYILYDVKGRPIRTHEANYLDGYTRVDSKLDFRGKPIYTYTYHKRDSSANEIVVKDTSEDTPEDRPLIHKQQITGQPEELIAKNEYNDLGQLVTKQVGGEDLVTYVGLQKVDYSYNIRGWLTGINNDPANDGILNIAEKDLFLFKINYNTVQNDIGGNVTALYNGNISETFWRSSTDDLLRKYGYKYDNLNRLTNAYYQKPENTVPVTNMYDEQMSYDKNGNIQSMQRNGDFDSDVYGPIEIDNLSYYYDSSRKNQLVKVTDTSNSPKGFKDDTFGNSDGNNDYDYDANGNMVRDDNKNIASITYNHLNLPVQINFGTGNKIEYLYDALGQKKAKKVTEGTTAITTDYLNGYQYTDTVLNFFPHAEGYVNVTYCPVCETGAQTRFNYVYQYKDHLGNIRLSYGYDQKDQVLKIIEENHYYPFGLKHTKYNTGKSKYEPDEEDPDLMKLKAIPAGEAVMNKYKYNGKEWQDELELNMYAMDLRQYDPAIGRFVCNDPVEHHYQSTYTAFDNNPVFYADPIGAESTDSFGRINTENGRYISATDRESFSEAAESQLAAKNATDSDKVDKNGDNNEKSEDGDIITDDGKGEGEGEGEGGPHSENQILTYENLTFEASVNVEYQYTINEKGEIIIVNNSVKINTSMNDWLSPIDKYYENKSFSLTINPKITISGRYIVFEAKGTFSVGNIKLGSLGVEYNPVVYTFTGVIDTKSPSKSNVRVEGKQGRLWQ